MRDIVKRAGRRAWRGRWRGGRAVRRSLPRARRAWRRSGGACPSMRAWRGLRWRLAAGSLGQERCLGSGSGYGIGGPAVSPRATSAAIAPPAGSRTGAATARTPSRYSPSSLAWPRARVADACSSSTPGSVIVRADDPAVGVLRDAQHAVVARRDELRRRGSPPSGAWLDTGQFARSRRHPPVLGSSRRRPGPPPT
jgi:hypothetical protein